MERTFDLKYAFVFLLLAIAAATILAGKSTLWVLLGCYVSLGFLVLAIAYGLSRPKLLMKQTDGRRRLIGALVLQPYWLVNSILLHSYRRISKEPASIEVDPHIHLGRRLTTSEARQVPWNGVLDLAAEFSEIPHLRANRNYVSMPLLDATAATPEQLQRGVQWMDELAAEGPVLVHCALGHGRSASVVVAYLLSKGIVESIEEGLLRLKSLGKNAVLNDAQRRSLHEFMKSEASEVNKATETRS